MEQPQQWSLMECIDKERTVLCFLGQFRLLKRHYVECPLADKDMILEDIPPLFRDLHKKDVSHEYFDTTDVNEPLRNILSGVK